MTARVWAELEAEVIDQLLHATQKPLATAAPPARPGVYALLFATIPLPCFDHPGMRDGGWPAYMGVADRSLAGRLTEHRLGLKPVQNLTVDTFRVITLEMPSGAAASFAEATAIAVFRPAYNLVARGLGSKPPGALRASAAGKASAFATLHPGRPGPTGKPKLAKPALEAAVQAHLWATVPPTGAWR